MLGLHSYNKSGYIIKMTTKLIGLNFKQYIEIAIHRHYKIAKEEGNYFIKYFAWMFPRFYSKIWFSKGLKHGIEILEESQEKGYFIK